ncbi:uncharacterized protein F4807DRAFT_455211 [Annulohypoxylon truncatum]|uniref:uncharacterized protein n=1 Tax=Annulohypoxylon truncatum TaxID=327061 RepID=UPI0020081D04|nr:uncharacterized protein F4807DRAFT_455211 [Annulohypoxylon truncatum]KAI1214760.1 hypothetical protein F4807DRAFT_455211 [Annulohypoxylon truncatum]
MPVETTITTPLPGGVEPAAVVALLHDHEAYIRTTCPQLISYKRVSGPSSSTTSPAGLGEPVLFEVVDRRPTGQTTYKLTLTNREEGIDSLVDGKAPTGTMAVRTRWRVRGDAGMLEEEIEIDSNMITKKMVKGNIEKGHPEHHRSFLAEAARA